MIFKIILLATIIVSTLLSSTKDLKKVSLQLNWKYQFEYAGFIAAKEKGFYKNIGLDVEFKEYDFGINVLNEIKLGKATFGIYDISLLELKDEHKYISLIANYFKRSALIFIANQDILTPADLKNKIIMADKEQLNSSTLSTLLKKFNIKKDDFIFKQHNFSATDFIDGKVDVISAYVSNELYHVRKSKKQYTIIDPLNYGIHGSGLNLYTSKKTTLEKPHMVKDFISATNLGWLYALKHKEELVNIIYEKYSKQKSRDALLFEANQIEKLIMPDLYKIGQINKSLLQKDINELAREGMLKEKFNIDNLIFKYKNDDYKLKFTQKQKKYIDNKKEITMCIDPDWMPYEKILDNNKYIGMTADYIPLLSKRIGIPIKLIPTKDWPESIEFAKKRKCDIFSLAMPTPSRLKYMNFTIPYISFPLVIATKMDKLFISNPESLITKKKIGIVKGYAIAELLKNKYPNHKIIDVDNVDVGMQMVAKGELFGFLDSLPTVGYILQHKYIAELKIAGKFDEKLELGIAVRNDDLVLFELFEKAIQSIDEIKKQEILNKYISVKLESSFDYKLFYQILGVLIIIASLGFYRHRQVLKYNEQLQKNQKQLEVIQEKLEASIESFEMLLDSVLEAVFVFENKICIDCNSIAVKMFGYKNKKELIGRNLKEFVANESYLKVLDKIKSGDTSSYEVMVLRKNGTYFPALVKGTNTIINYKQVRISAVLDMSDIKSKEKLLSQQTKMAAMGQMLENIAHQWRQPLSLISTISTGLELKKQLELTTKDEEILELKKINKSAQHLSQTIEDFRNFFKTDKEKVEFSVLKSLKKSLNLLDSMLKNSEIKIIYEKSDDVIIKSYENEFMQALVNVFYNAKDAMTKIDENRFIFINLEKKDNFIIIKIRDNGGGISEEIIENIFEPYFTTKHQSQGTGIGLYMTHEIIQNHMNGIIEVKNTSYKYENNKYTGAEFTIKIPL